MTMAPRKRLLSHTIPGAFTLIELLVVISIIAVLIAVLLPAISAARRQAIQLQCASNLRQLCLSLMSYDIDYKNFPPGSYNRNQSIRSHPTGQARTAIKVLYDGYKVNQQMVRCPEQKYASDWPATPTANPELGSLDYWYQMGNGLRGANDPTAIPPVADSSNIGNNRGGWFYSGYEHGIGVFPLTSLVKTPKFPAFRVAHSEQFLLLDIGRYRGGDGSFYPVNPNHPGVSGRAPRGVNVLHADGHTEWHVWEYPGRTWAIVVGSDNIGTAWWTPRSLPAATPNFPTYEGNP